MVSICDAVDRGQLVGTWLQLHEESSAYELVFTRQGVDLPPSRGRFALAFAADGSLGVGTPGPDDRSRDAAGGWELDGDVLTITAPALAGSYVVVEVGAERLVLRRRDQEGHDGG